MTVPDAHFLSYFADARAPTKWKKLTPPLRSLARTRKHLQQHNFLFYLPRSLVGYSPWSSRVGHDWATSLHFTINQLENCLWPDKSSGIWFPCSAFKNALLKPTRLSGLFEHCLFQIPCILLYNKCWISLQHNPAILIISRLVLLHMDEQIQVGLVTALWTLRFLVISRTDWGD